MPTAVKTTSICAGPQRVRHDATKLACQTEHTSEVQEVNFNRCQENVRPTKIGHETIYHRENGAILGMVALIIKPIYSLYSGHFFGYISPFKGLQQGLKQLGATTIFPMNLEIPESW